MGLFLITLKPTGAFTTAWTLILDGNVDLSLTLCVLNTILSYGESVLMFKISFSVNFYFFFVFSVFHYYRSFSPSKICKLIGMTTFWFSTLVKPVCINVDIEVKSPALGLNQIICYTIIPLAIGVLLQYFCRRQHTRYAQIILKWTSITYILTNILYTIVFDIIIFFSFPFPMFWLVSIREKKQIIVKLRNKRETLSIPVPSTCIHFDNFIMFIGMDFGRGI